MQNSDQKNTINPKKIIIPILIVIVLVIATTAWVVISKALNADSTGSASKTNNHDSSYQYGDPVDQSEQDSSTKKEAGAKNKKTSDKKSSQKNKPKSTTSPGSSSTSSAKNTNQNKSNKGTDNGSGNSTTRPPNSKQSPLLIKHGWDIPTASFVGSHVSSIDSMPFDGLVMSMNSSLSSKVQTQSSISYNQFKSALSPATGINLKNVKHNFVMVYTTPAGDIFNSWSTVLSNYTNMARAANEAGLEGIFYDNEEYYGSAMSFSDNCKGGKTVSQCRDQAFLRGKQVMEAIRSGWPSAKIIVAHGPYISDSKSATYLNNHGIAYNDVAWANELRGPFAIGMASATVGNSAQFIDGGEIYSARTSQNFKDIKYWQKQGMAQNSSLIPSNLKSSWSNTVSASFGIYDQPTSSIAMDSSIWKSTLINSLNNTDRYVWLYTERHDWWGTGWPSQSVPSSWVTATKQAHNTTR